jgi:hypothetical protein
MPNPRLSLLAGLLLVACDPGIVQLPADDLRIQASLGQSGIAATAHGAAHRESQGRPVILNFSATLLTDGSASGQYYFREVASGTWIRVGVTCMSTRDDNKAYVAGLIEDSSHPQFVGTVSYFFAFDNGEGAGTTDIVSRTRAADRPGQDLVFCAEQPELLGEREVLHGNVNVSVY